MIRYKVFTTAQADLDILNIEDYISTELLMPASAEKIIRALERKVQSLSIIPDRGNLYEKEPWRSRGVRIVQVRHYKIIYYIDKAKKTVTILHVAYARQDIDRLLK